MIKIRKYSENDIHSILQREDKAADVGETVSKIIHDVRENGDTALFEYAEKFDKANLEKLDVSQAEIDDALSRIKPELLKTIEEAAENIRSFHLRQVRNGFFITGRGGAVLGQRITPIEKVGIYVPGGTAAYPSTVLMNAVPAKIAGCGLIVMATPPNPDGTVNPAILAAATVAGVDKIYKIGGAGAVAALAYGTRSVPRVDKIVGPGNIFVAEAKRQVFGQVAIDMIAGPSEILVIADGKSSPARHIAADMLSQAEHDKMATAVLITDNADFAYAVAGEIEKQIVNLPRYEIARASVDNNGKIIIVSNLDEAVDIANILAPEHLEICADNPFDYLDRIKNAGSVFLGKNCPEAMGDYFAGPNHTLPTGGTAKFSSPLSVDDFVKKTQITYYGETAFRNAGEKVIAFAEAEGLAGHAQSVDIRLKDLRNE